MRKVCRALCLLILLLAALCAVGWLYLWLDYLANPLSYAAYSAPWYAGMLPFSCLAVAVMLLLSVACLVLTHLIRRR